MTTLTLNRAAAYGYTNGYEMPVSPPDEIPFGDTESGGDLEQCVLEFDVDPADINTALAVTLEFKLNYAAAGTKYVRRWTQSWPTSYGDMQSATALSNTTNQVSFTDTGTATVSLDVKALVADMATNSQPKVVLGIRETGDDGIYGAIDNDANKPTLTYTLAGGGSYALTVDSAESKAEASVASLSAKFALAADSAQSQAEAKSIQLDGPLLVDSAESQSETQAPLVGVGYGLAVSGSQAWAEAQAVDLIVHRNLQVDSAESSSQAQDANVVKSFQVDVDSAQSQAEAEEVVLGVHWQLQVDSAESRAEARSAGVVPSSWMVVGKPRQSMFLSGGIFVGGR